MHLSHAGSWASIHFMALRRCDCKCHVLLFLFISGLNQGITRAPACDPTMPRIAPSLEIAFVQGDAHGDKVDW